MNNAPQARPRRLGIATQVFFGLGLGLITGIFFGEEVAFLQVGGDIFIAALQITVIPYVVVALITSLGRLTLDEAKSLALKAGLVLLLLWGIGLTVVLTSPMAFPDWPSASFFSTSQIAPEAEVDFLRLYVPSNIFFALANAIVPAIVVFSILFGVALIRVDNKHRLVDFFDSVADALMNITGFVGRLAPYGVFAITASAAGTIDVTELARLQVYVVLYVLLALLLSLWVVPGLVAALTPLRHGEVLRAFKGPLITAFATASLLIVLPVLAADGKRLVAAAEGGADAPDEQEASAIDILVPAAFPFPNLGSLMALMFVLFGGWLAGQAVSVADFPTLAGAGIASLFGGTVLALPFLLDLLRLPADLFQTFIVVDVVASRFGTLLAGMHIIAIALIGSYALRGEVRIRPGRLLRFAAISLGLLAAVLFGVRAFYSYVFIAPFTKDQVLAGLPLRGPAQPHTRFDDAATLSPRPAVEGGVLTRVKDSGVLRVCHRLSDYPSAFVNTEGDLVGFDIEMAHHFARQIDAALEFLPVASIKEAVERVEDGYCDLYMSLLPLVPEMTLQFALTAPVMESAVGLVVEDHRRRQFQTWAGVVARQDLRIAVLDTPESALYLQQRLPAAHPILLGTNADVDALLAERPARFDALVKTAEEGAAWTIRHPRFSLVTPTPVLLVPLGYAAPRGDTEMQAFFDAWLRIARGEGTVDRLYRYWMLGEIAATRPPRWSVARDRLGWFE